MDNLLDRKKYLEKTVSNMEAALKKAPDGKLRFARKGKNVYYYCRTDPKDPIGQYIRKKDILMAAKLAQKDYNKRVLNTARKEIGLIDSIMKHRDVPKIEDIFDSLEAPRQVLIHPVALSDRQYAEEWLKESYKPKEFADGSPEFYTDSGLRVRSKSEILIGNALEKMGVPFRYECPLTLNGLGTVHPDFTVLNVKKRKVYFWEHFGMMDDPNYIAKALYKIEKYEENGYFPGDQLIITHETSSHPLNMKLVYKQIRNYLM